MKTVRLLLALIIALVFLGCDGATHLQGTVRDARRLPLEGVRVTLEWPNKEGKVLDSRAITTGADGAYDVGFTHAPFNCELVLRAEKEGYSRFEKRFYSNDRLRAMDIELAQALSPKQRD